MQTKTLAVLNILALISALVINSLANILPINGMNTGEVSALYPSLFTPAGITFSIWSIIYLLLIGFVVIQWKLTTTPFFAELSIWFIISCIANMAWILVWHNLYIYASVAVMLVLLYSLTRIFLLLRSFNGTVTEELFIKTTFTIYFSWICVATIANISALLVSIHWSGNPPNEVIWTILLMTIATSLSLYIISKFKALPYSLVTIWALFGIYLRSNSNDQSIIARTALTLIAILIVFLISTSLKEYHQPKH